MIFMENLIASIVFSFLRVVKGLFNGEGITKLVDGSLMVQKRLSLPLGFSTNHDPVQYFTLRS